MSAWSRIGCHPTMYEIFARVWLAELSRAEGRPLTLADVPDAALDRLASLGFDYVYLMGVWKLGAEGPRVSRSEPRFRAEYDQLLPGWTPDDVIGSPFAVARYVVDPALGGDDALAVLRRRLAERCIGLVLDFVPNHVAPDHPALVEHPELFVHASDGRIMAGKDPYFPPWPDTAQLDYRVKATRAASIDALSAIAERCDGVRCDMAMLVLDDVFRKTWAHAPPTPGVEQASGEFWAEAIDTIRARWPEFLFIAEAYWDLEWRLQMLGFDYTYDKSLYDRLVDASARSVRGHLSATPDYQRRSVHFLENHDEPRIATVLPADRHRAAAVIAATAPGMRFFHEGQLEGKKTRASLHLGRRLEEPVDKKTLAFYENLLDVLKRPVMHRGSFAQLSPREVASGNASFESFVVLRWDGPEDAIVAVVNLSATRGQCRVVLDLAGTAGRTVKLVDRLSGEEHTREGDALLHPSRGLFVDLPAYGAHLFEVRR